MCNKNLSVINLEDDKFKDECGVFGIYLNKKVDVASITYYGLYALQHRGQQSSGIAVSNGSEIKAHKGKGIITEAFTKEDLDNLINFNGNIAIGHVMYSTDNNKELENAQPLVSTSKLGQIATANNGSLVNGNIIKELLEEAGYAFHTNSDAEIITSLIARGAKKGFKKSVVDTISVVRGSFALVIMSKDKLIGIRDPHGIRPLCIGKIDEGYILSSESCAIDAVGGEFIRDVKAGEIVVIDENGIESIKYSENTNCQTCSFEYIYFARPDSFMDELEVEETRKKSGEMLYKEHKLDADIVIAVPDSGIPAAMGYSKASGIPYDIGFVKNRYVGRTFIAPSQELRERAVSIKLNPLKCNLKGKKVVMIDDSIVRGTTSKHLIDSLKRAGAKEVYFLVASPIVKFPCYFGIDTPYRSELIGANKNLEEIKNQIGCDYLGYLSLNGVYESLGNRKDFCVGCFNGIYPLSAPMESLEENLER